MGHAWLSGGKYAAIKPFKISHLGDAVGAHAGFIDTAGVVRIVGGVRKRVTKVTRLEIIT